MSAEKGKEVLLGGGTENIPAVYLKPVVMTWAKKRWDMWVLRGTALRGWNCVFLTAEDAAILVSEGFLFSDDGDGDVADEPYKSVDELPVAYDVNGAAFYGGLICFDSEDDFCYVNESDDPENW